MEQEQQKFDQPPSGRQEEVRPRFLRERIRFPATFFPRDLAPDIAALDAFLDYCFGLIDLSESKADARRKLTECQRDVEAKTSRHKEVKDFFTLIKRHSIPQEYVTLLFEGFEEDRSATQLESDFDLIRHCYKTSAIPLLMLFHMFEAPKESGPFAIDLGIALELTRIGRDIALDAAKGKYYLPQENVRPDKIVAGLKKDQVWELAILRMQKQQFERAERYLESATPGVSMLSSDGWVGFFYLIKLSSIVIERTLNLPTRYLLDPYQLNILDKIKALLGARSKRKLFSALNEREYAHDSELHIAITGLPGAHEY